MMPAEITLTENMRVRCRGRVTRVLPVDSKFGVAVHLEGYEYLSAAESAAQASPPSPGFLARTMRPDSKERGRFRAACRRSGRVKRQLSALSCQLSVLSP